MDTTITKHNDQFNFFMPFDIIKSENDSNSDEGEWRIA